jgi:hypothetical protein
VNCSRCASAPAYLDGLCAYCWGFVRGASREPDSSGAGAGDVLLACVVLVALLIFFGTAMYAISGQ